MTFLSIGICILSTGIQYLSAILNNEKYSNLFFIINHTAKFMEKLFERLKLKDQFDYALEIEKDVFFENLSEIVDKGSSSDFASRQFDRFVDGDNDYIGSVSKNDFRIRKRYKLFNNNSSVALGKINVKDNTVLVSTSVTAFNDNNTFAPIVFLILYIGFSFYWYSHFPEDFWIFFRNITIFYVLMLAFLFVLMRKAVGNLTGDLEAEFDFIQIKNKKETEE
ncbi:hypothetical protein [Flavobacterium sp. KACC 22761]|uniref:hypothetical protein n=1 Tax=Flavobacterium sp. KACC 22761 TaxID=3092665 RepID=UPI002A74B2DB|nr:hypothetical protein [Flavobacterium sp. KACC 22761]WPO79810.1 hypothetical protein SCB73_05410 [Flavobacterium sp. KACC 22761]